MTRSRIFATVMFTFFMTGPVSAQGDMDLFIAQGRRTQELQNQQSQRWAEQQHQDFERFNERARESLHNSPAVQYVPVY